jgi:lysophospholipase L1-like esterase
MRRTLPILAAVGVLTVSGCAAPGPSDGASVAFYGDSYTLGTGASSEQHRWSTIVSKTRNWEEINPSVNGLGFFANRGGLDLPGAIIATDPDIVFITMGLNDNFLYDTDADAIHAQLDTDIDRLASELPDARLIVVEPFWYTDYRPDSVEVIIGWVKDAATRVDADYIPGASRWIEGHPEWMAADLLHPNDAGYAAMAERMEKALVELGL